VKLEKPVPKSSSAKRQPSFFSAEMNLRALCRLVSS